MDEFEQIVLDGMRWPSKEEQECLEELCRALNAVPDEVRMYAVSSFLLTAVAHSASPWDAFRWIGQAVEAALPAAIEELSSRSRPN